MVELMLVQEDLRVAAEQPSEQVLAGAAGTKADLEDRRLEGLVVSQATASELRLDRLVEVVGEVFGDATGAVTPDARQRQHVGLVDPRAEEDGEDLERCEVLLTDPFVGSGRASPNAT